MAYEPHVASTRTSRGVRAGGGAGVGIVVYGVGMRQMMGGMRSRCALRCIGVFLLLVAVAGCGSEEALPRARLSAVQAVDGAAAAGFARVFAPRPFVFPADHGPHQEYATEWWYYTGNLDDASGHHFGFQLTFFRFGLTPKPVQRAATWATANIYMAHLALTDVAGGQFYAFDRFSRDGAGLAGASGGPYHVWLDDWSVEGAGDAGVPMRLRAAQGVVSLDLTLGGGKPVVLQGDRGVSRKSDAPGNASYYYSLTRMPTDGTLRVGTDVYAVRGLSWMDREWSTSALGADVAGWDWFALQLSDGRDVMFFQLRHQDGSADPVSSGTLVDVDGTTRTIARGDLEISVLDTWRSPQSGARYPARWRLQSRTLGLDLDLKPYVPDQELRLAVTYWEGAVQISGTSSGQPVAGNAYVELTGYAERQDGQSAVRVR